MHPDIAHILHQQRVRDELADPHVRAWRDQAPAGPSRRRRSLRRRVGRSVVRIGLAIEAEPRRPVASR